MTATPAQDAATRPHERPRRLAPLAVFAGWAALLLCVLYVAGALANVQPPWRSAASNWDTGWYLSIVEDGYQTETGAQSNVAFFPLYPMLVAAMSRLGADPVAAGVVLSLACFLAALFLLHRLLRERFSPRTAWTALLLLAFWPFSFFFGLVYTESLFLLLVVAAFLFVDRQRWWAAAAAAGLASATRAVGVFVGVALLLAYFQEAWRPTVKATAKLAVLGAVSASGLVAFMVYLQAHTGDFLAFLRVQRFWPGRGRGFAGLGSVADVLKAGQGASYDYVATLLFVVPLLLFLGLSLYVAARIDVAWGCFCILTLLAPVPTGTLTSSNRYVLVLFPCFAAAAKVLGERAGAVVAASAGLLGLFAYHYAYHPGIFVG